MRSIDYCIIVNTKADDITNMIGMIVTMMTAIIVIIAVFFNSKADIEQTFKTGGVTLGRTARASSRRGNCCGSRFHQVFLWIAPNFCIRHLFLASPNFWPHQISS